MEIAYSAAGAKSWTALGDEASRTIIVTRFDLSMGAEAQISPLIRGSSPFRANRDNRTTSLGLAVHKFYATAELAMDSIITWKAFLDGLWDWRITSGGSVLYIPSSVNTGLGQAFTGLSVIHSLTITGGEITETEP
jgi:hypothetical protein